VRRRPRAPRPGPAAGPPGLPSAADEALLGSLARPSTRGPAAGGPPAALTRAVLARAAEVDEAAAEAALTALFHHYAAGGAREGHGAALAAAAGCGADAGRPARLAPADFHRLAAECGLVGRGGPGRGRLPPGRRGGRVQPGGCPDGGHGGAQRSGTLLFINMPPPTHTHTQHTH
jgi:hypothetical protein